MRLESDMACFLVYDASILFDADVLKSFGTKCLLDLSDVACFLVHDATVLFFVTVVY